MRLDEQTITTRALFATGLGVSVLGGLLVIGIEALSVSRAAANTGDTPVILVGGSMTFKAGAYQTPQTWSMVTANQEYYVTPDYQISTIVLKAILSSDNDTTDGGDANPTTDKLRLDVSTATTWEIDEFAGGNTPVVKIVPQQSGSRTQIHLVLLDTNGRLCPVNPNNVVRIRYSPTQSCPAPPPSPPGTPLTAPIFSQVSIRLNNDFAPDGTTPQPTATLNCIDSTTGDPMGRCRIALKGIPPN